MDIETLAKIRLLEDADLMTIREEVLQKKAPPDVLKACIKCARWWEKNKVIFSTDQVGQLVLTQLDMYERVHCAVLTTEPSRRAYVGNYVPGCNIGILDMATRVTEKGIPSYRAPGGAWRYF